MRGYLRSAAHSWRLLLLLVVIFSFVVTYIFSMYMLNIYVLGDQYNYTKFWHDAATTELFNLPSIQLFDIGGVEPVFGILIWTASRLFDRDMFISTVNGIFICTFVLNLRRFKTPYHIIFLLMMNYYMLVLLIPAERVKFAITIFMIGMLLTGWKRAVLLIASPLCHFQMLISYFQIISALTADMFRSAIASGRVKTMALLPLILLGSMALVVIISYGAPLAHKISAYDAGDNILGALKIVVLYIGAMIYCRNRWQITGAFVTTGIVALIIGPQRTNMLAYVVFCYFFMTERRYHNWLFLIIAIYFVARSVFFISQVMQYGVAFSD